MLGLTYRHGVKELAYSRALPLIERLRRAVARVVCAFDPLLDRRGDRALLGAMPWPWGSAAPRVRAIVTQTADPLLRDARPGLVPGPRASSSTAGTACATSPLPAGVAYRGVGVRAGARSPGTAHGRRTWPGRHVRP